MCALTLAAIAEGGVFVVDWTREKMHMGSRNAASISQGNSLGTQQTGVAFQSGIVESRQRPFHSDTSRAFRRCRPTIPRQVLTNECPDTHASAHTTHHKKSVPSPQKRRDTLENDPRQRLVSDRLSRGLPRPPQKSSKVCKNSAAKMS